MYTRGTRPMIWVDPAWAAWRVKVHHPVTGPQMRGTGGTLFRLGKRHRDRGHPPLYRWGGDAATYQLQSLYRLAAYRRQ
jgi:hypothetical protein